MGFRSAIGFVSSVSMVLGVFAGVRAQAEEESAPSSAISSSSLSDSGTSTTALPKPEQPTKKPAFGMDLNSFISGPGLAQSSDLPVALNGGAADSGQNAFNLISMKYRFSERLAFDVQFRNQYVFTKEREFRHQGQRFGLSGKLLKGEDWSLSGAVNTDIPVPGIVGQINEQRTLLFNPGAFAFFNYAPSSSRWSLFALLTPRFFFYRDINAVSSQDTASGQGLAAKPEYILSVNPSINYAINDSWGARLGVTAEYSKYVAWEQPKFGYFPVEFGVTYNVTPDISIYPYVYFSTPVDDALRAEQGGQDVAWWKTASLNLWVSAAVF